MRDAVAIDDSTAAQDCTVAGGSVVHDPASEDAVQGEACHSSAAQDCTVAGGYLDYDTYLMPQSVVVKFNP